MVRIFPPLQFGWVRGGVICCNIGLTGSRSCGSEFSISADQKGLERKDAELEGEEGGDPEERDTQGWGSVRRGGLAWEGGTLSEQSERHTEG